MNQAAQIDSGTRDALQQMVVLARQGRREEARKVGKAAVAKVKDTAPLHALLGRLACECGDFQDGIAELKAALDVLPEDAIVRCDLAAALIQTGDFQAALEVCDVDHMRRDRSLQIARFRGYAAQQSERWPEAIEAYRHVVDHVPGDAATLNNLGNALQGAGELDAAIEHLKRAVKLDPASAPMRMNLATTLVRAGRSKDAMDELQHMTRDFPADPKPWVELASLHKMRGQEHLALEPMEEAAKRAPDAPSILVDLGNQRSAAWDRKGAEEAFRRALTADPQHASAYVALASLYEHDNQPHALQQLASEARESGIDQETVSLVEAFALRRAKEWDRALACAEASTDRHDPIRRAHLIGEIRDRLGESAGAFSMFEEMNRLVSEHPIRPLAMADHYWKIVEGSRNNLTPSWFANWTESVPIEADERPSPVFLVGFPRSGTTLLDTMLMGHSSVQVIEERPALIEVETRIGGFEGLPTLSSAQVRDARRQYWIEAAKYVDLRADSMLVDKSPFYLNKTATAFRLFPDTRFIFALRHPMDVVLSCFITNFRPNPGTSNFLNLRRTAELYDLSMSTFFESEKIIGFPVFTVSYERMIADREAELRPLFDWLGLDWREEALDHQATAAKRGIISTASYSQVHEPLYTRSTGRWTRYAKQLEPVREILEPWVKRFGYSLDDPAKLPDRETE